MFLFGAIVNFAIAGTLVLLVLHVYRTQYLPTLVMEQRFLAFALRDELAELVSSGLIDEESELYQFPLKVINDTIRHLEQYDAPSIFRWKLDEERNKAFLKQYKKIVSSAKSHCPSVALILRQREMLVLRALELNSWMLRHPIVAGWLFAACVRFLPKEKSKKAKDQVREKLELPDRTSRRLGSYGIPEPHAL